MLNADTKLAIDPATTSLIPSISQTRVPVASVAQIKHIHSDGVYVKAYKVPSGLQFYTKQFPTEHVSILGQGSVIIEKGTEKIKVVAPAHVIIEAMTRCKITTLDEAVWYCIHVTTETDQTVLDKLY
jgi:hypothetical protein